MPQKTYKGFSVLEVLVALLISGVLAGMAMLNARALYHPSSGAAESLANFIKAARSKALATTSTYTIVPVSSTVIKTTVSTSCSSTTQEDDLDLVLEFEDGASLDDTNWSICFSSRGTSNSSATISVSDNYGSGQVQVVLGGGTRIL